jgi:hypothetical protein
VVSTRRLPPTRAARLVAWGNAFAGGWASLDDAADRVVGADVWHRVDGLPGGDDVSLPVALGRLSVAGATGFRLALPVPGDVSDLPGPFDFNVEALTAGEAVLLDGPAGGLVPTVVRHAEDRRLGTGWAEAVRWRFLTAAPSTGRGPSLAEADRALAGAVREATAALSELDVAGMGPATAEALSGLRSQPVGTELAPGYSDRAREVLRKAHWLVAVVALATEDDGAAVSAAEIGARTARLAEVARAARAAIVAAHNSPGEATGHEVLLPR